MKKEMRGRYDAIVIGAGVVGCAAAYSLAGKGLSVLLVDRGGVGSGASGGNPGFLVLLYRECPQTLALALKARDMFSRLERELGIELEVEFNGGLIPVKNPVEEEAVAAVVEKARSWGLGSARMVTAAEAGRLEPALDTEGIRAAAWCSEEGRVNPFRLSLSLAQGAARLGATVRPHCVVTKMHLSTGPSVRIEAVELADGTVVETGLVVNAAGAWARDIARMAGLELGIHYHRGEAMVTEPIGPVIKTIVTDGAFFVGYHDTKEMRTGACLTQTRAGNVVIAQATTEVEEYDRRNTYQGLREVAAKAAAYFPALAGLEVIRCWAAVTPYTEDLLPVCGFSGKVSNMFVAASFPSAVGLAPAVGELIAEAVTGGVMREEFRAFSPDRVSQ